jgi:5-methyltetrahydropteroyltriglutamate--homocysteine methyltransferase
LILIFHCDTINQRKSLNKKPVAGEATMTIATTTMGTYPKPDYVPTPAQFKTRGLSQSRATAAYNKYLQTHSEEVQTIYDRASRAVIREQVMLGIDVPADGEIRRENPVDYICRRLVGVDWTANGPTVTGPIGPTAHFLPRDWRIAQEAAMGQPVKISVPGPLTIAGAVADFFYGDEKSLSAALSEALNTEIRALTNAGCVHIQIDEPGFIHQPEKALNFGFENLERCFHAVPKEVIRTVNLCGSLPGAADDEAGQPVNPTVYFDMVDAVEYASIQAVAIADNSLPLLEKFAKTTVIWGVVDAARTRIEPVDEIAVRLQTALEHIDAPRLMAAPNGGLHLLDYRVATAKLKNMVTAARKVGH